jgi:2-polyprenyl-3-methyl-5-hydroxy-6-metoxy-1,4-benzoquinol methylase
MNGSLVIQILIICGLLDFKARVSYRTLDMNYIPEELNGKFDFVWSTCSVEHVGTILLGQRFIINTLNLLKPGGIAIHTVEFNLSDVCFINSFVCIQ